jgi:hypothetical protein
LSNAFGIGTYYKDLLGTVVSNDNKEEGYMGLIRRGEERLVIQYLERHYRKRNLEVPAPSKLQGQAKKIVDEAHRIARETGGNVISIIKEIIDDLKTRGGSC